MDFRLRVSDTAVLRLGPLCLKWSPAAPIVVILMALVPFVIYLMLFVWYANTAIAHTYPDDHTNFWFGLLHGFFIVPSFIVSWFNDAVTIFQSPNDGFWYNLGFLLGIGTFVISVRSTN